jgi:hypothetical protein
MSKPDTRHLFVCFSKMSRWDSEQPSDFTTMSLEMQTALYSMPVVIGADSPVTNNDAYYVSNMEYITRVDNKYYYTNTEGFPYSRYTLPLYNFIPNN